MFFYNIVEVLEVTQNETLVNMEARETNSSSKKRRSK